MQIDRIRRNGRLYIADHLLDLETPFFKDRIRLMSSSPSLDSISGNGDGAGKFIEHTVTNMDTLAGVAIKYGVEVADIKGMNGLVNDLQIFKVPADTITRKTPTITYSIKWFSHSKNNPHLDNGEKLWIDDSTPEWIVSKLESLNLIKKIVEKSQKNDSESSWRYFIDNPDRWWDNRKDKLSGRIKPKSPDFKHKDTGVPLWLNSAPGGSYQN